MRTTAGASSHQKLSARARAAYAKLTTGKHSASSSDGPSQKSSAATDDVSVQQLLATTRWPNTIEGIKNAIKDVSLPSGTDTELLCEAILQRLANSYFIECQPLESLPKWRALRDKIWDVSRAITGVSRDNKGELQYDPMFQTLALRSDQQFEINGRRMGVCETMFVANYFLGWAVASLGECIKVLENRRKSKSTRKHPHTDALFCLANLDMGIVFNNKVALRPFPLPENIILDIWEALTKRGDSLFRQLRQKGRQGAVKQPPGIVQPSARPRRSRPS
jgi:hypothetical protein